MIAELKSITSISGINYEDHPTISKMFKEELDDAFHPV
jgi:hypothetical protein